MQRPDDSRNQAGSVLNVKDLSICYRRDHTWRSVVDRVSFDIKQGKTLCLLGESGSGKSSIALAIARLTQHVRVSGQVIIHNQSVYDLEETALRQLRRRHISFIFQNPEAALLPHRTIGQQVLDVICFRTGDDRKAGALRAQELLEQVGLAEREVWSQYPHQLSGGMCQRVLLVMALCIHPKLVIADEPTSSVDAITQSKILSLLLDLQDHFQFAMLFITHDLTVAALMAHAIGVVKAGALLELQATEELFNRPRTDYSRQLISAAQTIARTVR